MSPLQAGILTVFSCVALIISLYCLFFMVPVKRFWERIRTLGGGLKGIEAHVNGVRESIGKRLDDVEKRTEAELTAFRAELEETLESLSRDNRKSRRELESLRKDVQSLQADLRSTSADAGKLAQRLESLTAEVQQLRSDFDALDVELQRAVQQRVADSFTTVESTVLSALEAIQEEILYGVSDSPTPSPPSRSAPPTSGSTARGPRENIITVEPLFANLRQEEREHEEEEEEGEEPPDEGGQD